MSELTVRFQGEDDWEAFVNHNSMDIVEEDVFLAFCESRCIPFDLEHLEQAYLEFSRNWTPRASLG